MCLLSEAHVSLPMDELKELLGDLEKRSLFDNHHEKSEILATFPMNTQIAHTVLKKIMVVGPRDLVTVQKSRQISRNSSVLASASFSLEEEVIPAPAEGVTRAELILGGCIIRQVEKRSCLLTILGELDFKIAQFLQKNVALKAGNYAQMVAEYVSLVQKEE